MLQNGVDPNVARLFGGLAAAIAERGYAASTIADIVRHARVSKRTFYEHFPDKESCFLASYRASSEQVLARIADAIDPALPWDEQVVVATRTYLGALEGNRELTRAFSRLERQQSIEQLECFAERRRRFFRGHLCQPALHCRAL